MSPYKSVVQSSIENITSKIESDFKSANLKFAVGVYRAYGDQYGTYEKPSFKSAKDAIEDLESITFNSGGNNYHWEAHYYGTYKAIEDAFDSNTSGESNIVILIGDAGDLSDCEDCNKSAITNEYMIDGRYINGDDVVKKMYEKNVSLVGYQVNISRGWPGMTAYLNFQETMQKYLRECGKKHGASSFLNKINSFWLDFEISQNETQAFLDPMFGRYKFPTEGSDLIKENDLLGHVSITMKEYIDSKIQEVGVIEEELAGICVKCKKDGIFTEYLKNKGFSIDDIRFLQNQNEASAKGWITNEYHGLDHPAFAEAVFVEQNFKIESLDKIFGKLSKPKMDNIKKGKELFYKALVQITKALIGDDITSDLIKDYTFNKIWKAILGVEFRGEMKDVQISQILTMDDQKFKTFYMNFVSDCRTWQDKDFDDKYTLWDKTLGNNYYWIPLEFMPGCKGY